MSDTPHPMHNVGSGDPLSSANTIDWNALINRRATKRTYGERDSSCGSGRSSVDSFLSEDFGPGSRSPSPEDTPDPPGLADSAGTSRPIPPRHTSKRDGRLDPDSLVWTRWSSDWDAKWRSVPAESALQQEDGPAGNAPASAAQLSSSSSLSLTGEDSPAPSQKKVRQRGSKHPRKSLAKAVSGAIQRRLIKKKAKKWFTQLTAQLSEDWPGSSHRWRQRRVAGEELLRIAHWQEAGDVAVARRFTKSLVRQETGLRAILRLCEDEEQLAYGLSLGDSPAFEYDRYRNSYLLLALVMLHVDRTLFLERVIPSVLREPIEYGPRGILFLATSVPDFFTRIDPVVIYEYGMRVLRKSVGYDSSSAHGTELLYRLFCHNPTAEQGKSTILSVRRFILDSATELCSISTVNLAFTPFLGAVVRISRIAEAKGILASILPSPAVMCKFIDHAISVLRDDGSRALLVKAIALLANASQISTSTSPRQLEQLGSFCMRIIRSPQYFASLASEFPDLGILTDLDKDAFSILCKLPEPIFPQELRSFIFPQSAFHPLLADQDPFRIVPDKLDLLLWISNARENTTEAHRALIGSDSCGFLQRIVASPVSSIWSWEERHVWRNRGLAMTCFGNIIERMDESELRDHVPREMIETAVAIKEDEGAPLDQRDQATFLLQRYTIAADRCGVKPYHREAETVTEDQKGREEKVKLGQAQVRESSIELAES